MPLAAEGEFALSRAELEMALGKWFTTRVDRISTPAGDHDLLAWLADVAAQQADAAALARYAPLAAVAAERVEHRPYAAMAARALGVAHRLAGRYAEAGAQLQQALAIFTELNTPWQAGRTRGELGHLALSQGELERARTYFEQALADFEALGAAPMAARVRQLLIALPTASLRD